MKKLTREDDDGASQQQQLLEALRKAFDAYDVHESGSVSTRDFLKLEIRHGFEEGDFGRIWSAGPQLSRADKAKTGQLSFEDFCKCRLRAYQFLGQRLSWVPTPAGLAQCALDEAAQTLKEREGMGPRYHMGIRQALKDMFILCNISGTSILSPPEWVLTQAYLRAEDSTGVVDKWLSEASFQAADVDKSGAVQPSGFLNISYGVLEETSGCDAEAAGYIISHLSARLQARSANDMLLSAPLAVYAHQLKHPAFQPPTSAGRGDNFASFARMADIRIPTNATLLAQIQSLLRLHLGLPPSTWLSLFYRRAGAASGEPPVHIATEKGLRAMHESMMGHHGGQHFLYVKNFRAAPKELQLQVPRSLEGRPLEAFVERVVLTGRRLAFDWETQLNGAGCNPPMLSAFAVGDVLVVRVPEYKVGQTAMHFSVYMDQPGVLSSPFLEDSSAALCAEESKASKDAKQGRGAIRPNAANFTPKVPNRAPPSKRGRAKGKQTEKITSTHLFFVALRTGTCRLFVEVAWDHAEADVARERSSASRSECPAAEASCGRIGPFKLDVSSDTRLHVPGETHAARGVVAPWLWWNGLKWSPKRGRVGTSKASVAQMSFINGNASSTTQSSSKKSGLKQKDRHHDKTRLLEHLSGQNAELRDEIQHAKADSVCLDGPASTGMEPQVPTSARATPARPTSAFRAVQAEQPTRPTSAKAEQPVRPTSATSSVQAERPVLVEEPKQQDLAGYLDGQLLADCSLSSDCQPVPIDCASTNADGDSPEPLLDMRYASETPDVREANETPPASPLRVRPSSAGRPGSASRYGHKAASSRAGSSGRPASAGQLSNARNGSANAPNRPQSAKKD